MTLAESSHSTSQQHSSHGALIDIDAQMLPQIIGYEIALAMMAVDKLSRVVALSGDPRPLFQALADRTKPPVSLTAVPWELENTASDEGPAILNPLGS